MKGLVWLLYKLSTLSYKDLTYCLTNKIILNNFSPIIKLVRLTVYM